MEFQAGILGIPVRRPPLLETTAFGAAGLAGLAAGVWADGRDFVSAPGDPTVFEPRLEARERDALMEGWRRAVHAARTWASAGP